MVSVAISQSNYVPWKGYFDLIRSVDQFVVFDTVQFTKRDWRNRNKIIGTSGEPIWLTIPVASKNKSCALIKDIVVADQNWRKSHFLLIRSSYRKSSYYSKYESVFEELYLGSSEEKLSVINFTFLKTFCGLLKIETPLTTSKEFALNLTASEKLLLECTRFNASVYFSGPSAKSYIDRKLFERNSIALKWMDYSKYLEYTQHSKLFTHNVSIIDMICNLGEDARNFF